MRTCRNLKLRKKNWFAAKQEVNRSILRSSSRNSRGGCFEFEIWFWEPLYIKNRRQQEKRETVLYSKITSTAFKKKNAWVSSYIVALIPNSCGGLLVYFKFWIGISNCASNKYASYLYFVIEHTPCSDTLGGTLSLGCCGVMARYSYSFAMKKKIIHHTDKPPFCGGKLLSLFFW